MKNLLTLIFACLMSGGLSAQDLPNQLYMIFEFMQVNDTQGSSYLEVEDYWTKIHEQRIADGSILGWDLWALTPSGSDQGAQYMTVTLFESMEKMLAPLNQAKLQAYIKNAHNSSEKELEEWLDKTSVSRDIMHQVYARQIGWTDNDPPMKEGMYTIMGFMKQTSSDYVQVELEIFKPMHQAEVNAGNLMGWGLCEVLLPFGSEAYNSHITFNFYDSPMQLAGWFDIPEDGEPSAAMAANQGLTTREMKHAKIGQLVKMIR